MNIELVGLLPRIDAHIMQLCPHIMHHDGVALLCEAREEIYRLREAILVQLCETEDSEYMTGAQRDQFARNALKPNAKLTGQPSNFENDGIIGNKENQNDDAEDWPELNDGLGVSIPDGYVFLPKKPSVELLEKFTGRGLMCGSKPHPDVYANAMRRYQQFLECLTPNTALVILSHDKGD